VSSSSTAHQNTNTAAASLTILVDPVIATGGTERVIVISILGAHVGVVKAAEEWADGTEVWIGDVDPELNDRGMIKPGVGDIGDRLFLTLGK
jgi:uracil phosphoribosyltransferase